MFYVTKQVHLFTDHRNILFVFAPLAMEPSLGRHIVTTFQILAHYLSCFNYFIKHIAGDNNVFADIMTRWLKDYMVEKGH